jgi:hypothetical protein
MPANRPGGDDEVPTNGSGALAFSTAITGTHSGLVGEPGGDSRPWLGMDALNALGIVRGLATSGVTGSLPTCTPQQR